MNVETVAGPEVIVIGAGPAGLTAALYLARYRREVLVIHDGQSRALRIPDTHNAPGFPEGVAGPDLIARMTRHAMEYGARIVEAEVAELSREDGGFRVSGAGGEAWRARAVVLASGIRLNQVDLPDDLHQGAIQAGVLRYCPICDGYEHSNSRIGVVGCDSNGAAEALFLRQYSHDITLMPLSHAELTPAQMREMAEAGVVVEHGALISMTPRAAQMEVHIEGRAAPLSFDVVYPALGSQPRSDLAAQLGVALEEAGCVPSRAVRDSGVPGFVAAGDVVEGLDQISVAMGHGAMAATNLHNWLRAQDQHTLQHRS